MKIDITKYYPCEEALKWYNQQPLTKAAWENCHRGDWMLWIAHKLNVNIRTLTLAKAYCAKTIYHLLEKQGSREAIVAAINFGRGLIDEKELVNAASAATYITNIAACTATYAADISTYVAAVINIGDYAAHTAANAAVNANAANVAKIKNQKKTADICRKYLTEAVFEKIQ